MLGLLPKDYFAIAFSDDEILSKDIVVSCAAALETFDVRFDCISKIRDYS